MRTRLKGVYATRRRRKGGKVAVYWYLRGFGALRPLPGDEHLYGDWDMSCRCVGYWDEIDEAWCPVGATWKGPWIEPTDWQALPMPPASTAEKTADTVVHNSGGKHASA